MARRASDLRALHSAIELHIGDYEHAPTVPAAAAGAWARIANGAAENDLAAYLPSGMPTDPGSGKYVYCVDTANTSTYLVGGILESTAAVAGDLDGAVTTYLATECRVTTNLNPSAVVNCTDVTGGNLDGNQTTSVFCLGKL